MPTDHRAALADIKTFPQLIAYLRNEMGWPISRDSFEDVDDLFYDFTAEELGIDPKTAAKITEIKRLKPLSTRQPWGIFFVKFEPKKLPVVALRRILSQVALKKRASANSAERTAWAKDDLLFVSNYGVGDERQISFAHFSSPPDGHDLPTLKVLGWDNRDTALHLDKVAKELTQQLAWPGDDADVEAWRTHWRSAFTLGHGEVVKTSKDLSVRLAKLAGDIRDRIKSALGIEIETGPLTKLMKAFQTSLVHDLDADGFADMYAQTIAYGLLSARIADPHKKTVDDFAGHMRTNPFLRELMETFLKVGGRRGKAGGPGIDFDELGVSEVVQLLDDANMEAVVLDFGDKNPQEDPVIHFYELFLREYDAKKRMQRGVFYTPRPVVSYIVRSVDELLRTEFGLEDGLADTTTWGEMAKRHKDLKIPESVSPDQDFVRILDPATGTGTFLVEVIALIYKTLVANWKAQGYGEKKIDALWNEYVPKHLLTRLHGYELLMAPYAIAHLKVGLKLYETGYRFGSEERARIYLTNALEHAEDFSGTFEFAIPALAHEAQAVNEIKRHQRFTVVVGNPPYSKLSSNLTPPVRALIEPYKYFDGVRIKEKGALQFEMNLQDDYIKFVRFSEMAIHAANAGVSGLICNRGFLDNPTLRGMRWSLETTYRAISVLDLRGHQATMEEGTADENVFDIKQGVAIVVAVRPLEKGEASSSVTFSAFVGPREQKYRLLSELSVATIEQEQLQPKPPLLKFVPTDSELEQEFALMVGLTELFPRNGAGFISSRDGLVVGETKKGLGRSIIAFGNDTDSESAIYERYGFGPSKRLALRTAQRVVRQDVDVARSILPCIYRPFDQRWVFYKRELIESFKPIAFNFEIKGNVALLATRQVTRSGYEHAFVSRCMAEIKVCSHDRNTQIFPLFVQSSENALAFSAGTTPNLSSTVLETLARALGLKLNPDIRELGKRDELSPLRLFHFIYAVLHCPGYRERYFEFLKSDFPRIPLTGHLELFSALAILGGELVALHLVESPELAQPVTEYIGGRSLEVAKISWSKNTVWIDKAQTTGFKGVREDVWNFHIGGYQICEKWLKDRKGRTLSKDDITHYQKIVVALAETIRLMREIDEVIEQYGGWPGAFQTRETKAATAKVIPFRPRTVEPKPEERYVACVPLVPLRAAAGTFGDPQHIGDDGLEWVAVESRHRLRPGMFVAQVVGRSMEPAIPDGAWCLFRTPAEGTRQGKTVLVQLRDGTDSETGERYTVKRYESEKTQHGDSWSHERITLKPLNPAFEPLVLDAGESERLQVVAEFLEVITGDAIAPPEDEGVVEPGEWKPEFELRAPEHQPSLLGASLSSEPAEPEHSTSDDRSAPEIDPDDLPCQIRALFSDGVSRDRETAIRQLRELLGYGRTGPVLREMLDNALRTAVRRGILASQRGELTIGLASVSDVDRGFLKEQFLASLGGRVWRDRAEATRGLARWLGFRRTGPVIEDAVRSVVNGLIREGRLEARKDEIRRAD